MAPNESELEVGESRGGRPVGNAGNAGCLHVLHLHGGSKRLRKSVALGTMEGAADRCPEGAGGRRSEGSYAEAWCSFSVRAAVVIVGQGNQEFGFKHLWLDIPKWRCQLDWWM